jgi:hypothetical protein
MDRDFALDAVTGVDWLAQNEMEVVYDLLPPDEPVRVVVRTRIPRGQPELPTIAGVFAGANWHERETHDFFGIRFAGHPNLKPFLLPEDATSIRCEGLQTVIAPKESLIPAPTGGAHTRPSCSTWARSTRPPTASCACC